MTPRAPGSRRTFAGRSALSGLACFGVSSEQSCYWSSSGTSFYWPTRSGSSTASSRAGSTSPRTSPSPWEPDLLRIREDVLLHVGAHALLLPDPELRVEQIAVLRVEDLAQCRIADQ